MQARDKGNAGMYSKSALTSFTCLATSTHVEGHAFQEKERYSIV
jgi:hypothetical protein